MKAMGHQAKQRAKLMLLTILQFSGVQNNFDILALYYEAINDRALQQGQGGKQTYMVVQLKSYCFKTRRQ